VKLYRQEYFGGVLFDTDSLRYELHTDDSAPIVDRVLPLRAASERRDILSAPIRVYFEITRRCNLTCSHCFVSSSPTAMVGMSTETAIALLDHMADMNVIELRITGGEPTARADWYQILDHAKRRNFVLSVNTNGVYDDNSTIDKLLSLGLEQITISIDGSQPLHDAIRGPGTFRRSVSALQELALGGARLRVNMVLTRNNVASVPIVVDQCAPYIREINFFYMRTVGRAVKLKDQTLTFESHFESSQQTRALKAMYPHLNIMHFEQSFTERSIDYKASFAGALARALPYGSTTLAVHCDGSVWPHGYSPFQGTPALRLGTFPIDNLYDVWHASPVLDRIRGWLRQLMERCDSCPEHRVRCAGLNFEMEIARLAGHIDRNPYCINPSEVPSPDLVSLRRRPDR
jgi:MoaA/NifB/PqqE/SkfB family radical SAM enzyme